MSNQSGAYDAFFGGFLASISARISGLKGSMDGSICFGSNLDTGRVGAILDGASLTTKFSLGFIGVLTTGATGVEGLIGEEGALTDIKLGVKFDPSFEAAEAGLNSF